MPCVLKLEETIANVCGFFSNRGTSSPSTTSPNSTDNQSFPIGTWGITTYLISAATSCTSNAATWRCYPYQTYNESATASLSTITWIISNVGLQGRQSGSQNRNYLISASDATFSYPFQNISLTFNSAQDDNDTAYLFTYRWRKQVVPSAALTSSGVATRCYFNNTLLTGKLYTKRPKDQSLQSSDSTTNSLVQNQPWPYAVEYVENISEEPECYEYVNGNDGAQVTLSGNATGSCGCDYRNFGV